MSDRSDIMVISAHPDDAEFGAAGSVAKWTREGRRVVYIVCTSGEKGTNNPDITPRQLAKTREKEQKDAADVLGVDESGLGALNAAVGIGALLGSLLVASLSAFRRKGAMLTAGSLLYPIGLLVFGLSRSLALSLGALALAGFAFVVQASTMNTLIQSLASDAMRGRVLSVYMLTFFGTAPFTALYAGAGAELLGPGTAVLLGAVIVLLYASGTTVLVPSLRRLGDQS